MMVTKKLSRQQCKTIFTLAVVAIAGSLGIDIHIASLPYIMHYMHTDKAHMQQSVAVFLFGMGASLLFYGPLSDRYGRRPIMILGLSFATVMSFLVVFSNNINCFLLARLLQGVGSGVCIGLGRAILADIFQGKQLSILGSYFGMMVVLSPILAPAIGGYIQHYIGWQANFIVLALMLLLALVIYALLCPETNSCRNAYAFSFAGLLDNYLSLLRHRFFLACTLCSGFALAVNVTYATVSAFIFQIQFHFSPVSYGWLSGLVAIVGLIARNINPFSVRRVGTKRTLFIGFVLLLIAGLMLTFLIVLKWLFVTLIVATIFIAALSSPLIMPNAFTHAISDFYDKRGTASALYGSIQLLIAFIISAIAGSFSGDGLIVLAVIYLLLGCLGIGCYVTVIGKPSV